MAGLPCKAVQFTYLPLFLLAVGCTTRPAAPIESARPGDRIATLPASKIDSLTLAKSDPASGDRWSAELRLAHPEAAPAFRWDIRANPPLADPRADGELIRHLIDSLETLKLASVPRASPLEAAGLKTPRFAIRWRAGGAAEEVSIGAPAVEPGQAYALVPALSPTRAVKVQGAFLRLLAELSSFDRLRQRSWSATGADDFDELELKRRGKSVFYAQRERDRWTDRSHRPVRRDAARILSALVNAPIREFVDDPEAARASARSLAGKPEYQAVFTDRAGGKTVLSVSPRAGAYVNALSSARPASPFRLDPTVLEAWSF